MDNTDTHCPAHLRPLLDALSQLPDGAWLVPGFDVHRARLLLTMPASDTVTDTQRVDWLEKRKYRESRDGGYSASFGVSVPAMALGQWQRDHGGEFDHKTLREAIDAAIAMTGQL